MNITKENIMFKNSGEMFPAFQGGNPKYLYCNDFEIKGDVEELLDLYNRGGEDEDYFEVTEEDCILLTVYMDRAGKIVADISSDYDSRELKLNEKEKGILFEAVKENYMNEHGQKIDSLKEEFYREMEQDYLKDTVKIADEDYGLYAHKIAEQFGISEEKEAELAEYLKNSVNVPFDVLEAYDIVKSYEKENIPFDEYAVFGNVTDTLYDKVYAFCKEHCREAITEAEIVEEEEDMEIPF